MIVETNRRTSTELGRGSEQTEVHSSGSSSSTKGAQTIVKTEVRPQIAATSSVVNPEIAATKSTPVHVGIAFQFTLKFRGGT
jgi:hypothetical protein